MGHEMAKLQLVETRKALNRLSPSTWWRLILPAHPLAVALFRLVGSEPTQGLGDWARALSASWNLPKVVMKRHRAIRLIRETFLQAIQRDDSIYSPRILADWLAPQPELARTLALVDLSGFYRVQQYLLEHPDVQAALAADGRAIAGQNALSNLRRAVDREFDVPKEASDRGRDYARLVAEANSFVQARLARDPAGLMKLQDEQFDEYQQPLLDACAGIVRAMFEKDVEPDLGVNFMHLVRGRDPYRRTYIERMSASSQDIYGHFSRDCDTFLIVGPTTEAARGFSDFVIPVYSSASDKLLPGAPAAIERCNPEELRAEEQWLSARWPKKLDKKSMEQLLAYFRQMDFAYCISLPVFAPATGKKSPVGVVNINTRRIADHINRKMVSHIYDILKPILVLLGSIDALRRSAALAQQNGD
jgi:hypothetical protein